MATRTTTSTKRTPAKKPASVAKKAPVKKTVAKKSPAKKAAASVRPHPVFSFRVTTENTPFFTFRVTRQSLYWFIFSLAILALGGWNLYLNMRVIEIYDQIDQNGLTIESLTTEAKHS